MSVDIISHGCSVYRDWAENCPLRVVFCLAKLALMAALAMIFCGVAERLGSKSEGGGRGMVIMGALIGAAWPLSPEKWGNPAEINFWILPLATFTCAFIPGRLVFWLYPHDEDRRWQVKMSIWLSMAATMVANSFLSFR